MESVPKTIELRKGANEFSVKYENFGTTYIVFRDLGTQAGSVSEALAEKPLSMKWNRDPSILPIEDSKQTFTDYGWYRFISALGLASIKFDAFAEDVSVWSDGLPCLVEKTPACADGLAAYTVSLPLVSKNPVTIAIRITSSPGMKHYGAAIPNPIKQSCTEGEISIGD